MLGVMHPSSGIALSSSPAPPSTPPPSPPALSVSPTFVPDACVNDPDTAASIEGEGLPRPLTCDTQCAGCSALASENARLQQAEQDALARIGMLEAELQHVRSQPLDGGPAAEADTDVSTEVEDSALVSESPVAHATQTPPPSARAQSWQVVVRGLPCSGNATTAVLHSAFSRFCCDRLHMRGALGLRVMRLLTCRAGTAAGVVALDAQEDYEALFRATREHLTEASSVSIAPNELRAERRARGEARRARRTVVPQQRAGAAGARTEPAERTQIVSTLRHDAPDFVPASCSSASQVVLPLCPTANPAHSSHQQ